MVLTEAIKTQAFIYTRIKLSSFTQFPMKLFQLSPQRQKIRFGMPAVMNDENI